MKLKKIVASAMCVAILTGCSTTVNKIDSREEAKTLQVGFDSRGYLKYNGDDENTQRVFNRYKELYNLYDFVCFDEENDTVPLDVKQDRLDNAKAEMSREIETVSSPEMRDFLTTLSNDAYLNISIRLEKDSVKAEQLYDKIDLNSWVGVYNFLPQWKMSRMLPRPDYDGDITPYGIAYIEAIRDNITDPIVKDALLSDCAMQVLDWGHLPDVDAFWLPFKEVAGLDNEVIKQYESKVESLKSTLPGMPAIDVEFTDVDGNVVKLSDLYGKVLYIDIWATWCGPCRREIPFVEEHVKHYKNNDAVQFVSISFDEDRQEWLDLLAKDKPQWAQYNTNADQHKTISKAYGINGIPRFIIINADGTLYNADAFRPSDPDFITKMDNIINSQQK